MDTGHSPWAGASATSPFVCAGPSFDSERRSDSTPLEEDALGASVRAHEPLVPSDWLWMSVRARILERISRLNLPSMDPVERSRLVAAEAQRLDVPVRYVLLLLDEAMCRERSDGALKSRGMRARWRRLRFSR